MGPSTPRSRTHRVKGATEEEKLCMTELSGRRWHGQTWHVQTEWPRGKYRPNGHVASNPLLCGLQGTLNGKYLRHTISLGLSNPNMSRILEYTRINEYLPHKEKTCSASKGVWSYATIKTQRPSRKRYAQFL